LVLIVFSEDDDANDDDDDADDDLDSDREIDLEEHQRRLRHVSRVKQATVCSILVVLIF